MSTRRSEGHSDGFPMSFFIVVFGYMTRVASCVSIFFPVVGVKENPIPGYPPIDFYENRYILRIRRRVGHGF